MKAKEIADQLDKLKAQAAYMDGDVVVAIVTHECNLCLNGAVIDPKSALTLAKWIEEMFEGY